MLEAVHRGPPQAVSSSAAQAAGVGLGALLKGTLTELCEGGASLSFNSILHGFSVTQQGCRMLAMLRSRVQGDSKA